MPSSPRLVPLLLSDSHREALRDECLSGLRSVLGDLARPDLCRDPAVTASAGEVYRRLLEALDAEEIQVPDEEMRTLLGREFDLYRKAEAVDEVMARGGAHLALLGVLDRAVEEEEEGEDLDEAERTPGRGWPPGDDADCRREVLDLLLSEAPNSLAFSDIAVVLACDPENVKETNPLRDAITVLVGAGLARR